MKYIQFVKELLSIALVVSLVFVSAAAVSAQSSTSRADASAATEPRGKSNQVNLTDGAKDNGYTLKKLDDERDGRYEVNLTGVKDPKTGKLLNGRHDLVYVCAAVLFFVGVVFASGKAKYEVRCDKGREFLSIIAILVIYLGVLVLTKGASKNGYSLSGSGGNYILNVNGAERGSGRKIEGLAWVIFICQQAVTVTALTLLLAKGNAERRTRCSVKRDPRLYY